MNAHHALVNGLKAMVVDPLEPVLGYDDAGGNSCLVEIFGQSAHYVAQAAGFGSRPGILETSIDRPSIINHHCPESRAAAFGQRFFISSMILL